MGLIRRLYLSWRNRHDVGLDLEKHRFGTKPPNATEYSYAKAVAGAKKASTRTASGRVYLKPLKPRKPVVSKVEPMRKRA